MKKIHPQYPNQKKISITVQVVSAVGFIMLFIIVFLDTSNKNISRSFPLPLRGYIWQKDAEGPANTEIRDTTNDLSVNNNVEMLRPNINQPKSMLMWHVDTKKVSKVGGFAYRTLNCKISTCHFYENKSGLPIDQFDAILFRNHFADKANFVNRSPQQRFVFFEGESPSTLRKFKDTVKNYENFFNWTATYRMDSDAIILRTELQPQNDPDKIAYYTGRDFTEGKTELVAWVVSHCGAFSGRDALVRELQNYIPVHVYGACGNHTCPDEEPAVRTLDCFHIIDRKYKFYLAFENSLCLDYVTEKFLQRLREDILPVTYGLANYSFHGPPHSYIDATSFKSVKSLADYLYYLDKNDTAYNEYFRWKPSIKVGSPYNTLCKICDRLYTDSTPKVYPNMTDWWERQAYCKDPQPGEYYLKP